MLGSLNRAMKLTSLTSVPRELTSTQSLNARRTGSRTHATRAWVEILVVGSLVFIALLLSASVFVFLSTLT